MKNIVFAVISSFCFLLLHQCFSEPSDLSVSAFENFKKKTEVEIERDLEVEFQPQVNEIETLSKPFKKGEKVSITILQGERKRQVTGLFKGIIGQYAEIDDKNYLLSDIEDIDSKRLYFAGQAQLLQITIEQRKKQLEEDKARRKEILLEVKYKEAGYTKEFFQDTVKLSGKFWSAADLGHRKFGLVLEESEKEELIKFQLLNATNNPSTVIVFMDKLPVFTNANASSFNEISEEKWKSITFNLLKEAMGSNSVQTISKKLKLLIINQNVGTWYLKPSIDGKPKVVKSNQITCPECFGSKKSLSSSSSDSSQLTGCKTCSESGMIQTDEFKMTKVNFNFNLLKSSIKGIGQDQKELLADKLKSALEFQQQVNSSLDGLKRQTIKEREEREKKVKVQADKIRELEMSKKSRENSIKKIEGNYTWFTIETAPKDLVGYKTESKKISIHDFDDFNAPSQFGDNTILKFTDWTKVSSRNRDIYGRKYRLFKVETGSGESKYYFQFQAAFTNSMTMLINYVSDIVITFANEVEEKFTHTYSIMPSWAGTIYGTHEIPINSMKEEIKKVKIEKKK